MSNDVAYYLDYVTSFAIANMKRVCQQCYDNAITTPYHFCGEIILMVCRFSWKKLSCFICQAFAKMFNTTPDDLDMHVIYDVSHNIAKVEEHFIEGKQKTLLVHRKGSTRAFPPHHPLIPVDYQVSFGNQVWIFYGKKPKYKANKPVWAQQLDAHLVMHALWPWRWRGWADAETYRLAWYNATILS